MAPFLPLEESTTDQIINYRDDIPKPVLQKQTVVDGKVKVEKEPPAATLRRTCVDDKGASKNDGGCPPIAIVGMALRLPGGVRSPDEFWNFLMAKKNGVSEVPGSRYTVDSFYSDSKPNSVKTRHGYYLQDDLASFDAPFFSINSYEAGRMDPQQRQLLEVLWECLESAGETNWRGKNIGCYVGVYGEDWLDLASKDPQHNDRYHILGTGQFALANRLSYEYDFQGPSMVLQTGCSASMVGLHEACQALYSGDCSSAIVAGTNLIFAPTMTASMSDNMVMSPTGMCRTFDEKADGYGRGEAINAIYIKTLDDALHDNDPIRAVIRSTSTNCDGRTPSITTPGSHSQEALVRRAYEKARINDISQTGFFECHGTGTVAGDTAEVSVVAKLFEGKGIVIGAVKPNIGHGEGASGISSVIKSVLSLEHNTIPPNVFFNSPNPNIPFKEGRLQVPLDPMPWPEGRSQRVSVNCFGVGGANAHVILDSTSAFCGDEVQPSVGQCNGSRLLVVSAKSADSLQQRIRAVTHYNNQDPCKLHDLAYTLGVRREHMSHRAFAVVQPSQPLDASAFQNGRDKAPELTLVFTGQGAQWPGMGKYLMNAFPEVRNDIQMLNRALQDLHDAPYWSLEEELAKFGSDSMVNEAEFSQPLCTALQIALVNVLYGWGIKPSSVVGHSSGEIAAAYAAGAITARSAIIIAYYRGKLAKEQEGKGAMAAVGLGRDEVTSYLEDGAVIACENSPQSVTLSGDKAKIDSIMRRIKTDSPDVLCRRVRVSIAYHSHHMRELGALYESCISQFIEGNPDMLPFFSSVTSTTIRKPQELNASYWRSNLESPVLFSAAVQNVLQASESNAFLEVGPHSALSGPLRQIFKGAALKSEPIYISTLTRNDENSQSQLLHTAGSAHAHGISVSLKTVNGVGKTLTNLPSYPWQHNVRYWHDSRLTHDWRFRACPHHELLGSRVVESSDLEPSWRNLLRLEDVPWIMDHELNGNIIFPGTGYIAMAGEAIRQLNPEVEDYTIKNLNIKTPLLLKESQEVEMITALKPAKITDLVDSEWYAFTIMAHDGTGWIKHCHGQIRASSDHPPKGCEIKRHTRVLDADTCYRAVGQLGFNYGPRFRRLRDISAHPTEHRASGTVLDFEIQPASRYTLHPTTMDHMLQIFPVALAKGLPRCFRIAVPAVIGELYVRSSASQMQIEGSISEGGTGMWTGQATMMAGDQLVLSLKDILGFPVDDHGTLEASDIPLVSQVRWASDIDLLSPTTLLPTPSMPTHNCEMIQDAGRLSLIYILETADRLANTTPEAPYLLKWKAWIMAEAERLRQGPDTLYLESQDWVHMSAEARQTLIKTVSSWYESEDNEFPTPFECMRHIYEECEELAAGKGLSDETRIHLDKYRTALKSHCDWKHFLTLLGHSNPTLRVLEIGAGIENETPAALEHLKTPEGVQLYSQYILTNASESVVVASQDKIHGDVEYKQLDITRDPAEQGFDLHSFDLIIASNVLHATPRLEISLRNVNLLLAPNGRLLLHELYPQTTSTSYIMGVLSNWWMGEEADRLEQPCVSPERWDQELRASGFVGNEVMAYDLEPPNQTSFTMLSSVAHAPNNSKKDIILLASDTPGLWAKDVASRLLDQGYNVNWGTLDQEPLADQCIVSLLDVDDPYLHNMSAQGYTALQNFLMKAGKSQVLWVTNMSQLICTDPRFSLIFGFARTLRHEMLLDISIFETDVFDEAAVNALLQVVDKLEWSRQSADVDLEYEYSFYQGHVHVGRCHWTSSLPSVPSQSFANAPRKLGVESFGLIDTLQWKPAEGTQLESDHVEVDMRFVGLNFRDVLVAMGLFGSPDELGVEGSGIIRRVASDVSTDLKPGDRVAVVNTGVFRTSAVIHSRRCIKLSDDITLEDAATMPSVYLTSIYCLVNLGRLKKGESVLIHSACGGVGLAAIRVCEKMGAKIFATVGSEEKAQYLMNTFGIPRHHIFYSRSTDFLVDVLRETNDRGVDVVLNSLAGKFLHASWECVAPFGRMIELGKRDFLSNGQLNMLPFIKNRAYIGFDLTHVGRDAPDVFDEMFDLFMSWYNAGKSVPIRPVKIYDAAEVVDAFRYMQKGVHMGKILIKMPEDPAELSFPATLSPLSLSPHASYLLVGGLGGLGRSVSTWMVEKGARHLVYLSRSAGQSEADQAFLRELEEQGCHATCVTGSVTEATDVKSAISQCLTPLSGVIQMSAVLRDRTFDKMTHEEWTTCLSSKVQGTWNLHDAVKDEKLDFFVVFGSVSGICGNPGQANYAAANTFLDSFTQYRRELGLPSAVVNLGAVEDVGLASQNPKLLQNARSASVRLVSEKQLVEGLRLAICQSRMPASPNEMTSSSCIIGLGNTKPLSDPGVRALWIRDARFALYSNIESKGTEQTQAGCDELKLLLGRVEQNPVLLNEPESEGIIRRELGKKITQRTAKTEEMDDEEISHVVIDSLLAIEIRSWARRNLGLEISLVEIGKVGTVGGLAKASIEHLKAKHGVNTGGEDASEGNRSK